MVNFLWSHLSRTVLLMGVLSFAGCTGLFFYPSRTLIRIPSDVGVAFERVGLKTPSEPTLVGWFLPANGPPRGTILFLHGNAENISTHLAAVHWLPAEGYQVFLFDYQGYGESEGSATVEHLYADTARAISYLNSRPDVIDQRLFLLGQSLGASLALYVAAQPEFATTFRAVVAESPFAGYRDIAREKLSSVWLGFPLQWPLGFLVDDTFSPNRVMHKIQVPVLLLHGTRDRIVPPRHSAELCEQLKTLCERWVVEGAEHGQILSLLEYRRRLVQFLDTTGTDSDALPTRSE